MSSWKWGLSALLLVACGDAGEPGVEPGEEPTGQAADDRSQERAHRIALVAKEIRANPDRAPVILAENQLTLEQFEHALYEIAADPEQSKTYAELLQ